MSTATSETAVQEAERYLNEVAPHLAALRAEERADLLDDLAQHLREIAAEPGPPLAERLGSPREYAAELLASAGVTVGASPDPALRARAGAVLRRARASSVGGELARLWPALRPAWWVARAYLAVSLLSTLSRDGSYPGFPVPRLAGSPTLGLLAVLVSVPLSVRLGQRSLPRLGRLAVVGANVVLTVYAVALLGRADAHGVQYHPSYSAASGSADAGCLLDASGQRITNLYAYDSDGRLLDPVLLYDQKGTPIDNLCPEFDERGRRLFTEYGRDVNGAPVVNAFPRRQSVSLEPGETFRAFDEAEPGAAIVVTPPAVVVPRLGPTTTTTVAGSPGG